MADYHPLDTRYKGPSTAYRGSAKKHVDPPVEASPTPPAPPQANPDGPWGKGPPPLPVPGRAPPPIPHTAPRPMVKRRNAGRRVLIGAVFIIAIVVLNNIFTRSIGLTIQDFEDSLREMETIDADVIGTDKGVKL